MSAETNISQAETHSFQTEVKQLLHLMVHALYSHREVFLRELISNAADAADKLRFEALSNPQLLENDPNPEVRIDCDPEARTITVLDNGIGMSREEVVSQLGTIARSGTADFLSRLTGDQRKDAQLIGQFGVGFYSAFMVAERVDVFTRRAGATRAEGVHWSSNGEGEFTVETIDRPRRGTAVVVKLKEDAAEFADVTRLRQIVHRYSEHLAIPVKLRKLDDEGKPAGEYETVNSATALWRRDRSEIEEADYQAFYTHIAHDPEPPLDWVHAKVEGNVEYTALLYLPSRPPFDLWHREGIRGLPLYVQRVFIMDAAEHFLPMYLRFVRGVIESPDLPLNVSRELLQQDRRVETIRKGITKRILDLLERLAKEAPEKYQRFWDGFGEVLKEGVAEDGANRERIAGLLRFATTHHASAAQTEALADYVARMKPEQDKIYYLTAENFSAAIGSPHLEAFRARGLEVLLLYGRIDEWVITALGTYQDKPFQDISRADLELDEIAPAQEAEETGDASGESQEEGEFAALAGRIKAALGDRVAEVRASRRLTESPACLVRAAGEVGPQLRELLKAAGQPMPEGKPILEVNPHHPLIDRLRQAEDEALGDLAVVLLEQANLAGGGHPADPADYVKRVNRLLTTSEAPTGS